MNISKPRSYLPVLFLAAAIVLNACQPQPAASFSSLVEPAVDVPISQAALQPDTPLPTPFPTRPLYPPGELVDYTAQTGDTLPTLAARFNTSVAEILEANPFIPAGATTMPPGMPMKIPIYYLPLWGTPFQIIPDSQFVNGPAAVSFNTTEFVNGYPGWLKNYVGYVGGANRTGPEIVDYAALNFSVSPRLLLALLEYKSQALSQPVIDPELRAFPLGYRSWKYNGLYMQLAWAANLLNHGYYQWRTAKLLSLEFDDGRLMRFDPWQNAATVSLHNYFNTFLPYHEYEQAVSPDGLAKTFQELFGDLWTTDEPHLPGSLVQPEFSLPFRPGEAWALTGGPHTGWGTGQPYAALDFAPPANSSGCIPTALWATAVAPGVVARSEIGIVMLDLDGDGDERTGWNILYLHVGTEGRAPVGAVLQQGDPVGHPSCEGGASTGTHVHLARKYNGEWMLAEGTLAFNLEGWIAYNGSRAYLGTLKRFTQTVTACDCSNAASFIESNLGR